MDKFILKRSDNADGFKCIVVNSPTHEKLMHMKDETGLSVAKIVSQMVDFCFERLHISED